MVIKSGKICFGNSVIDCMVADISPGGARVRTDVLIHVPDVVVLRFSGGSGYFARVQWARGLEIGLGFERPAPLADDHAALVALSAWKALPMDDFTASIHLLRDARFFDDLVLLQAAENVEAAFALFKRVLKERIGMTS